MIYPWAYHEKGVMSPRPHFDLKKRRRRTNIDHHSKFISSLSGASENKCGSFFSNKFSLILLSVSLVLKLKLQGGLCGESRLFLNLALQNFSDIFNGRKKYSSLKSLYRFSPPIVFKNQNKTLFPPLRSSRGQSKIKRDGAPGWCGQLSV